MSDVEERRARIERALTAAWDRGDVDALDDIFSPDYARYTTTNDGQDLRAFKASILTTREAFPDLTTVIDDILIEGDRAAVRWHSTGTHSYSLFGVPATMQEVQVCGSSFARFVDGRIVEEHVNWDPRALLSALGIIRVGHDD